MIIHLQHDFAALNFKRQHGYYRRASLPSTYAGLPVVYLLQVQVQPELAIPTMKKSN